MKKSTKVVLIFSSIILVFFLVLIGIISYFEKLQPEEIVYPGSGLSGSIFDTQNTTYTPNASFPEVYGYKNVPYLLDVPASNKASVGDGTTYRLNNGLYIYTSEFPFNTDIDYTLSHELGKTLMLDCNDDMTIVETMKEEIGYRNGFGIVYDCKNMYISNGEQTIKAILLTYYVELPEEDEDVLIGVIATVESNEAIRQMKDVLDAELATFRYDEKHLDELVNIINKAVKLSENDDTDLNNIHQLGEGWIAEEALAIAIYCALKYQDDFSECIITAVNHNGDSDSTGAIAGNILGAYIGYDAIDNKWKEELEIAHVITDVADLLADTIE